MHLMFLRNNYIFLLLVLMSLVLCSNAFGQNATKVVDVSITGLEDPLLGNVQSSLSVFKHQDDERMTESTVNHLYKKIEPEVKKALEPFGYYAPDIQKEIRKEGNVWFVDIRIAKGEPVLISEVDIRITGAGKDDESLRKEISRFKFPLRQGDILDHQQYEKGKKSLSSKVIAFGYRNVIFKKSLLRVNRRQLSAKIELILDTGPRYMFGKTEFDVDFISTRLLNRMLPYKEGEPYSPRKIVQMRQAFLNSDYFSQVDVSIADVPHGELEVPVKISLRQKNPNKYGIGVGYGTDTGLRGSLEWTNRLLNKYGHQFNMLIQPSERKSNFGIVYTIPIYDPRSERVSLLGKWEKEYFDTTETEARYATVSYDHIGEKNEYSIYLEYLDEDYEIGLENGHATFLYPGFKTTWRWADDRLKTKRGLRLGLEVKGGSQDIMSDASFVQTSVKSKAIVSFLSQWRVIGRFDLGWTNVEDVKDLSPSLRFYAGGDQSVRGFDYKSIGPTDAEGNVTGGSHLLTYSVEIERLLFGSWSAAIFFDSGDAMNSLSDLDLHNGIGAGIRWNAPFGQVRIDVANGVSETDNSWRLHFNVGADL